jgi:hypothetical protein
MPKIFGFFPKEYRRVAENDGEKGRDRCAWTFKSSLMLTYEICKS